jgi:alcohol dehydrogenase class IV
MTGHDDARAEDLVALLQQLRTDLAIPGLRAYGLGDRETSAIIEAAARASSMRGNPVALNTAELHAVLDSAL